MTLEESEESEDYLIIGTWELFKQKYPEVSPYLEKHPKLLQFFINPFKFYNDRSVKVFKTDLNILRYEKLIRDMVFKCIFIFAGLWLIMGFDSGVGQFEFPAMYLFESILKGSPVVWDEMVRLYYWSYGKYMHFSVFVIYGSAYYFLSRYYHEKLHIKKCQNVAYSVVVVLFSIGVFEYFWMICYYVFQGQLWILKLQYPQTQNL